MPTSLHVWVLLLPASNTRQPKKATQTRPPSKHFDRHKACHDCDDMAHTRALYHLLQMSKCHHLHAFPFLQACFDCSRKVKAFRWAFSAQTCPCYTSGAWSFVSLGTHFNVKIRIWQETDFPESEGRLLGVKLDEDTAPSARQDRRNVDMEQTTASGNGRLKRPASKSASHKGKQVTELCTSPKTVLQLRQCSSQVISSTTKQAICISMRSGVWLFAYGGHQQTARHHCASMSITKQSAHVVVSEL